MTMDLLVHKLILLLHFQIQEMVMTHKNKKNYRKTRAIILPQGRRLFLPKPDLRPANQVNMEEFNCRQDVYCRPYLLMSSTYDDLF